MRAVQMGISSARMPRLSVLLGDATALSSLTTLLMSPTRSQTNIAEDLVDLVEFFRTQLVCELRIGCSLALRHLMRAHGVYLRFGDDLGTSNSQPVVLHGPATFNRRGGAKPR